MRRCSAVFWGLSAAHCWGNLTDRFGAVGFIAVGIPLLAAALLSRRIAGTPGG
ncbi:hypothetical protein O0544_01445 [Edwardsiella anguillarum]|nr:hypothetical protein [Edwardsiella anguillarum]